MNIRIDMDDHLDEDEIVIRCAALTKEVMDIQRLLLERAAQSAKMTAFKRDSEYYLPLSELLFFETDGQMVYAHTASDAYRVAERLYALEQSLPGDFLRVSKSAILNVQQVFSIHRNMASSSLVTFYKSHKQVYVSRRYFKMLRQRLAERRRTPL